MGVLTHNGLSSLTTMDILSETKITLLLIILDQEIKIEIQSSVIIITKEKIKFGFQKWLMVMPLDGETQLPINVWKLEEDYSILIPAKNQIPIKCFILDTLTMHQLLLLLNPLLLQLLNQLLLLLNHIIHPYMYQLLLLILNHLQKLKMQFFLDLFHSSTLLEVISILIHSEIDMICNT